MKLFGTFAALLLAAPLVGCDGFGDAESSLSDEDEASGDCTLTQGYWKNHPEAWPVASLKLGSVTYTKAELIAILKTPVKGNGLIQLSHQLIAAKLNIAAGASDVDIRATITAADALIGSLKVGIDRLDTKQTSALNDKLDAFNNGKTGPGHCDKNDEPSCDADDGDCDDSCDHDTDGDGECDEPTGPTCGDGHIDDGETCDDGNTTSGDGCDSACLCEHEEPAPVCGNDTTETGEACDDGNTTNGDGCSATCTLEPLGPICGNGIIEAPEECDDYNLVNGDGCSAVCICD